MSILTILTLVLFVVGIMSAVLVAVTAWLSYHSKTLEQLARVGKLIRVGWGFVILYWILFITIHVIR